MGVNGPKGTAAAGAVETTARDALARELRALRQRVAELEAAAADDTAHARNEQRFRIVAEQTGQLVYDYDTVSGQIAWAGAIERVTGFTEAEFAKIDIGGWEQLIHPEDREGALGLLDDAMRRVDQYRVEYRFRRKDGGFIHVEDRGVFLPGDDGTAIRMLGTMSDVTQRKHLEAQLRHRQKLESLGVLAGGIAHDFNNLLTTILGNADIAAHQAPNDARIRKQLDAIAVAGRRAGDLCRQLLAYSGKAAVVVGPVDLNDVLQEMDELLRLSISPRVQLALDLCEAHPTVKGNTAQLRQVAMNLIMNASESLGDGSGRVLVRTGCHDFSADQLANLHGDVALRPGRYAVLTVADNGCGMDADTQKRVFDPFFTSKFAGRGLGLAAVIGIVCSHHGGILLDSTPGRGTTFRVLLPPIAEVREPPPVEEAPATAGSGTVLVVDDDALVRQVAEAILEDAGYEPVAACDGRQALELFERQPDHFVCVMLDLIMPDLGGEQVMAKMREQRPDLPILLCSGYGEMSLSQPLGGDSPTAFLQKPYTVPDLQRAIKRLIERTD